MQARWLIGLLPVASLSSSYVFVRCANDEPYFTVQIEDIVLQVAIPSALSVVWVVIVVASGALTSRVKWGVRAWSALGFAFTVTCPYYYLQDIAAYALGHR